MSESPCVLAGRHEIRLEGEPHGFGVSLSAGRIADDLYVVTLVLAAGEAASPPKVTLAWSHPIIDVHARWYPARIGDMKDFVKRVHDLGMKFLLWYSLPFVGEQDLRLSASVHSMKVPPAGLIVAGEGVT